MEAAGEAAVDCMVGVNTAAAGARLSLGRPDTALTLASGPTTADH